MDTAAKDERASKRRTAKGSALDAWRSDGRENFALPQGREVADVSFFGTASRTSADGGFRGQMEACVCLRLLPKCSAHRKGTDERLITQSAWPQRRK